MEKRFEMLETPKVPYEHETNLTNETPVVAIPAR